MPVEKDTIEAIIDSLEKGERLGLKEASRLIDQSSRLFGGKDAERFFGAAKACAATKANLTEFYCPPFKVSNLETGELLSRISKTDAERVYLDFSQNLTLDQLIKITGEVSHHVRISSLSPSQIQSMAKSEGCTVQVLCHEISAAGISYVPGIFPASDEKADEIDEVFNVLMQLSKVSVKSSVWLPLSFSDKAKIDHLSKIREFDDLAYAVTHVFFHLNTSFSDNDLLKTIAIARLMLDYTERLSFVDYQMDYTKTLSQKLRNKCIDLGINQIGII